MPGGLFAAYHWVPRLFSSLALARADGRFARILRQIAKTDLHILDDWGPETLTAEQRRNLLEIIDDRHEMRSVIITSQVPVERWYEIIGDPTMAVAILDHLVHNAYRIELKSESLRKKRNPAVAVIGRHWSANQRPEPSNHLLKHCSKKD